MIDDGRLLVLLGTLGLVGASVARGSRAEVRKGRGREASPTSPETVIELANGKSIRCNAYPEEVTYVRVVDSGGYDLAKRRVPADFEPNWVSRELAYLLEAAGDGREASVSWRAGTVEDEAAVWLRGGGTIRCEPKPNPISYVRVVSSQGSEVGYWSLDEIIEDPAEVIGAILGAALGEVR